MDVKAHDGLLSEARIEVRDGKYISAGDKPLSVAGEISIGEGVDAPIWTRCLRHDRVRVTEYRLELFGHCQDCRRVSRDFNTAGEVL